MEDEELLNLILRKLYEERLNRGILSIRDVLADMDIYLRQNQLNRVMVELKSNGFVIVSKFEDDFQAEVTPEGIVYCEEVLMFG